MGTHIHSNTRAPAMQVKPPFELAAPAFDAAAAGVAPVLPPQDAALLAGSSNVAPLPPPQGKAAAAPLAGPSNVAPPPPSQGGAAAVPLAPIGPAAIKAAAKAAKTAVRSAALAQAVLYGNVLVERCLKRCWTDDNWLHVWVCARCGLGEAGCGFEKKCNVAGPRTKKPKRDEDFVAW